jgi:hypothetical protein
MESQFIRPLFSARELDVNAEIKAAAADLAADTRLAIVTSQAEQAVAPV